MSDMPLQEYEVTLTVRVRDYCGNAAIGLADLLKAQRQDWILGEPEIVSVEKRRIKK